MRARILLIAGAILLTVRAAAAQDPADSAWTAGQHDRARELYAQRVAADSNDVQALHRLALLRSWNREFAEAIRLFDRLLSLTPNDTAVVHARARVLSWAGRFDAAEREYRSMLSADPSDAEALRGLARVASWRGDLKVGEELWRNVLTAYPNDVDARIGLSQVLRWRGQPMAALAEAQAALRLAPDNRDAQLQLAWAEAAFAPRIAPSVSAEFDSDDNQLITTSLSVTGYIARRAAFTAQGYLRRAEDNRVGASSVESRALSVGSRIDVSGGWTLGATFGVNDRDVPGAETHATYGGSFASPSWKPASFSLSFARSVLDGTALLIERGVTVDEGTLALAGQLTSGLRLEGSGSGGRFTGTEQNDRFLGRLGLEARLMPWLRVRPRVTAFWFEKHVDEGYFNPDFYMLGELGVGVDRYRGAWSFGGEVAPGAQQIGSDGTLQGALSARARVGYAIGPGREIGISFAISNLGIERFQANNAGYRYQAAVISAAWGF